MFKYLWIIVLSLYFFIGGYFVIKDIKECEDSWDWSVSTKVYFGIFGFVLFDITAISFLAYFS